MVQRFHAETDTFHLSCGEYADLPFDWTAILGLRFGGYPVPFDLVDFVTTSKLLGICYFLTLEKQQYFWPTDEPQIHMEWLKESLP